MPSWPPELPATPLADAFSETAPDTLLRTQMDQGPAKVRRRTSAGTRLLALGYILSAAQVQVLDDFFQDDLEGGALSFDFTHPRNDAAIACRFKKPPAYTPFGTGHYRAALELEVLP